MKRSLFLFTICACLACWAPASRAADVRVRILNPPPTGTVSLLLFDSAKGFDSLREPIQTATYPLDGREVFPLDNISAGRYALLVHHDVNGNGAIDRNFIGIPKEPIAFSNGYRPKGPPSYKKAAFLLDADESRTFEVNLFLPLGKRGRVGIGVGMIGRSSPYQGYDGGVFQAIPAITYTGTKLQLYGPSGQLGLAGSDKIRLALTGEYRIGAYEDDESDFLKGLGDREDTFMAGLALQVELPNNFGLSARYAHDVLDQIGGGSGRLEIDKSLPLGAFRFSPQLGLNWLSARLSNHDFGVPAEKATSERSTYNLDSTISVSIGLGMFVEITRDWLVILNVSTELLDSEIIDSPIVDEDYVVQGFAAVNYLF